MAKALLKLSRLSLNWPPGSGLGLNNLGFGSRFGLKPHDGRRLAINMLYRLEGTGNGTREWYQDPVSWPQGQSGA